MMTYIQEINELVILHVRAQSMDEAYCKDILKKINRINPTGEGSWGFEWKKAGELYLTRKMPLEACQYFNLARFPFPTASAMHESQRLCVSSFAQWMKSNAHTCETREVKYHDKNIPFYFYNAGKESPLLLVMGGIVSLKEQWGTFLSSGKMMKMSVIVSEMPGVGENQLVYDDSAYNYVSALIDAVASDVNVDYTHAVMMSFSGNLAIKQSLKDQRIKAITTIGAPIQTFFNDRIWWDNVPETTKRTLSYLCHCEPNALFDHISQFSISNQELAAVNIPVYYIQSLRDEIIPKEDSLLLNRYLPTLNMTSFDDVHGSPNFMPVIQKLVPLTVLKESGTNRIAQTLLSFMLGYKKALVKLRGKPSYG